MSVIEVENVVKEYRLGEMNSVGRSLRALTAFITARTPPHQERFKALDHVTLKVNRGEVVGIIGANGAGKSTLLKLLSGITSPTAGIVKVNAKVAPLIEVGAGLVPEMTGRENIFVNGAILGIPKTTIQKKVNEIIEFAELEHFIDTPVKRYSSGMKIRLGFAIATSVDADILIVDEVLAVGDLAFQRKCFDRMESLIKNREKTVLIVSHNIRQVERICNRVILLDGGKIQIDADSRSVCNLFYQKSNEKVYKNRMRAQEILAPGKASGEIEVEEVQLLDRNGRAVSDIRSGDPLRVRLRLKLFRSLDQPEIVVGTHTTDFVYLSAASTFDIINPPSFEQGVHEVEYIVPSFPLAPGTYCVRAAIFDKQGRMIFSQESIIVFRVAAQDPTRSSGILRTLELGEKWRFDGQNYDTDARTNAWSTR